MSGTAGSSGWSGSNRLDQARAEPVPEDGLDLVVDPIADRRVVQHVLDHVLADDPDAHAGQRLLVPVARRVLDDEAGVRLGGNQCLRHRRVDPPGIEAAERRVGERVQNEGRIRSRSTNPLELSLAPAWRRPLR